VALQRLRQRAERRIVAAPEASIDLLVVCFLALMAVGCLGVAFGSARMVVFALTAIVLSVYRYRGRAWIALERVREILAGLLGAAIVALVGAAAALGALWAVSGYETLRRWAICLLILAVVIFFAGCFLLAFLPERRFADLPGREPPPIPTSAEAQAEADDLIMSEFERQ
jgi:MFS family permease